MGGMHDRVVEVTIPPRPWLYDRYYAVRLPGRLRPLWPSWPWKRLVWTHAVAIAVGLLLAAFIISLVRWDGTAFASLGPSTTRAPHVRVGQPVTVPVTLQNTSDGSVILERVGWSGGGSLRILRVTSERSSPVRGLVVPAHGAARVNVRLRAMYPGDYLIYGVRVWYRGSPDLPVLGAGHYVQTTGQYISLRVLNP
jgi:hypothetical protein